MTIISTSGSTSLAPTAFASLQYSAHRAAYAQAQPGGTVAVGDRLLLSTSAYPTGYSYQISDNTAILAAGALG